MKAMKKWIIKQTFTIFSKNPTEENKKYFCRFRNKQFSLWPQKLQKKTYANEVTNAVKKTYKRIFIWSWCQRNKYL